MLTQKAVAKAATTAAATTTQQTITVVGTFRTEVIEKIASASKALDLIRKEHPEGFTNYLGALSVVAKYEGKTFNSVGFLINPDVTVSDAVKTLDFDNKGTMNGANLITFIKAYSGSVKVKKALLTAKV